MNAVSVPGYEIIDPLGRGGFGVVYRARQVTIDREVAIKVDTRLILDDRDQRRFLREVRAAGRLSGHPHVVELYDAGVLPDSRPYLVMELCPGGSLADRGRMSMREVVEVGQKIADALGAAHDLGVLHRDIKPGNILVKRYGTVALADFGLAAVVEAGRDSSVTLAALTPAYAAPEAFHLHPPTVQSDVYALTATLYTLLTGHPPRFPAEGDLSLPEIMRRHDSPIDDVPDVAPELMSILRRGLAKNPDHRYPEAAALAADLNGLTMGDFAGPRHAVTHTITTIATPRPARPRPPAPSPPSLSSPPLSSSRPPHAPATPPSGHPGAPRSHPGPPQSPPWGLPQRPSTPPHGRPSGPPPSHPRSGESVPTGSRRSRRPLILAAVALVAAFALLAGVYFVIRGTDSDRDPGGSGSGGRSGDTSQGADDTIKYGVPTVTDGCPAAEVAGAGARCTKRAQCWSGILLIQGQLSSVRELPCDEGHVFETFAIAAVPPAVVDPYQDALAEDPSVRKVCSVSTLLDSRHGDASKYGETDWSIEVLPPTPEDRARGRDIYRCVATLPGVEGITGSMFRPR
ncbi:MAG: protein kinase domain-containing protein [Actinophytocola sp.]|uniref:serine/threonine-protein kinase n=1 Tax=Actinophytocola sp. TaxID=1872138 RepID=UPI003D6BE0D2